jgi:HEPN domain-containing protein
MVQVQSYREASRTLLNQAYTELEAGDTRQASEKGWGATAQMLKAIAQQHGEEHQSHRGIRQVAFKVARETDDKRIASFFRTASDLHTNWYENWDTAEMVEAGLNDVRELLGVLEAVLDAG